MPRKDAQGDVLQCSFCGKSPEEVQRLIAGPTVYICDACIDLWVVFSMWRWPF